MKCKRCKMLINERDWTIYVCHQWETHGLRPEDTEIILSKFFPEIKLDYSYLRELINLHKETGKTGAEMFKRRII